MNNNDMNDDNEMNDDNNILEQLAINTDSIQSDIGDICENIDRLQAYISNIDDSLVKDNWRIIIQESKPHGEGHPYSIKVAICDIPYRLGINSTIVLIANTYSPRGSFNFSEIYLNPTAATVKAASLYNNWQREVENSVQEVDIYKRS